MQASGKNQDPTLPATGALAELEPAILDRLCAIGTFATLPEGKYLAVEGRNPDLLSVIVSGSVRVTCHAHGDTIHLATLGAGETVGEMAAIDPHRSRSTVRTSEETQVWQVPLEEFNAFIESDTAAGFQIMRVLAKELCRRIHGDSERALKVAERLHTQSFEADY